jgi:pyrroloquinoline quinone (PQQ) biosynthesis protein C
MEQLRQTRQERDRLQAQVEHQYTYYNAHVKNISQRIFATIQQDSQTSRVSRVAEYCLQGWSGNLLYLGADGGELTQALARLLQRFDGQSDRRLVAVPLQTSTEAFWQTMASYKDVVEVVATDQLPVETIQKGKYCFAMLGNLASSEQYDQAIDAVSPNCQGVIAIDGIQDHREVEQVFQQQSDRTQRQKLYFPLCREGYLLWS